ncbi:MAG: hypothetical protein PHH37_03815 [Paludibacter sp.]|nr:hypothetical protein [Paludibacter sp.]
MPDDREIKRCEKCMNRMYNSKGELLCKLFRPVNTGECDDYLSMDAMLVSQEEEEKRKIKLGIIEKGKKSALGVYFLFIFLGLLLIADALIINEITVELAVVFLAAMLLYIVLFYFVFLGMVWAKRSVIFFVALTVILNLIRLLMEVFIADASSFKLMHFFVEIVSVMVGTYILHFLLADRTFKIFFNYQKNKKL